MWLKEIAIAREDVPARWRARAALENELPAHELAVIFADRAFGRAEAGIGAIGAAGPFPDVAEKAGRVAKARRDRPGGVELIAACRIVRQRRRLPFGLGRQPRARPARIGVGFVEADMRHR